ncbi:MAG: RNA polymerase factor sigma-54 [Bacteroidia bacterium]
MLRQGLHQKMLQKLSPQQIQLMKLLQVPTIALEQRIKEELEVNPALEEGADEEEEFKETETDLNDTYEDPKEHKEERRDDFDISEYITDDEIPSYKTRVNNTSPDDDRMDIPISSGSTFQDQLKQQVLLYNLDDKQHVIAEQLIGNLDDDGYLRRDLRSISNDLAFSLNVDVDESAIQEVLKNIQSFDPPGIGARDLRECLLLQLQRKSNQNEPINNASIILEKYMDEFSKKHFDKIMKQMNLTEEKMKEAVNEILRLNPRPGNSMPDSQKSNQHIVPDFIITNNEGELELVLNSRNAPELRVSRSYVNMLEEYSKDKTNGSSRDAVQFVKQKLDSAKWFIDAIKQRQHTLLNTMETIMEYQYDYFMSGDETKLRPMILKDIADRVNLDISTVSRVANSKYAQTPFGTFLLKSFFSEALQTDSGEEVSSREVKKILMDCIEAEHKKKPLTDQKLVKILNDKGYNIARRTVAKYREQLNIPVARMRKEL